MTATPAPFTIPPAAPGSAISPQPAAPQSGPAAPGPTATTATDPRAGVGEAANPAVIAAAETASATTPSTSAIDPQILAQIQAALASGSGTKAVDPTVARGDRAYFAIWGVKPPHGYIEALVKAGLNADEITAHELSKPAAQHTHFWRDGLANYAAQIAQLLGRR